MPNASAGASFQAGIANGRFQGVIAQTTPTGCSTVISSISESALGKVSPQGWSISPAAYRRIETLRAISPRASR